MATVIESLFEARKELVRRTALARQPRPEGVSGPSLRLLLGELGVLAGLVRRGEVGGHVAARPQPVMLLPSVIPGTGPFPNRKARWTVPPETLSRETIAVAAAFYLAMMTTECLTLAGADGDISVEGPFANNALFLEMLAAAVARPVFAMRSGGPGTSIGAALLTILPDAAPSPRGTPIAPREHAVAAMVHYADAWRQAVRRDKGVAAG